MPEIVHYLERVGSSRYYDEHDLAVLQRVYEQLCAELAIPLENKARRETIAVMTFQLFDRVRAPQNLYKSVLDAVRNSS